MQIAEGQGYINLTRLPIKMVVATENQDKLDITRSAMAQSLGIFVRQIVSMFIASGADNIMDAYDEENADDVLQCFGVSSMTMKTPKNTMHVLLLMSNGKKNLLSPFDRTNNNG